MYMYIMYIQYVDTGVRVISLMYMYIMHIPLVHTGAHVIKLKPNVLLCVARVFTVAHVVDVKSKDLASAAVAAHGRNSHPDRRHTGKKEDRRKGHLRDS